MLLYLCFVLYILNMKVIALLSGLENLKILYLYRFPCDDSEVTLNVCLGKQFSGGELFLWGVRCEDHVNTETQSEVCYH